MLIALPTVLVAVAGILAQEPKQLAFEVASVRPAVPGTVGGSLQFLPGGRFRAVNVQLDFVLQQVYGVQDFQIVASASVRAMISGASATRYHIEATGSAGATEPQVKEMVKTLLAERFRLALHTESREMKVYALVPASGGVKGLRPDEGRSGPIISMVDGWIRGSSVRIPFLAEWLGRVVGMPVLDRTGVTDPIDFDLMWSPPGALASVVFEGGCPADIRNMAARRGWDVTPSCPSIFTAVQEQLGMKLDAQSGPVEVLVIDSVQQPTEN